MQWSEWRQGVAQNTTPRLGYVPKTLISRCRCRFRPVLHLLLPANASPLLCFAARGHASNSPPPETQSFERHHKAKRAQADQISALERAPSSKRDNLETP